MTRRFLLALPFAGALAKAVGVKPKPPSLYGGARSAPLASFPIVTSTACPKNAIYFVSRGGWIVEPSAPKSYGVIENLQLPVASNRGRG